MTQSVSALCEAGQLETAYQVASAGLAERPDNQFAQHDMFVVVLACLKKYNKQADVKAMTRWVRKLAALQLPVSAGRDEQLGWELRSLLGALAKQQNPPHQEIAELLQALIHLPLAPMAGKGSSVLLQAALKFREQLPAAWWSWWNLDRLRPEDFEKESYTPASASKAVRLPALAESAYGAYAKSLLKQLAAGVHSASAAVAAAEMLVLKLEALAAEHPDYSWLGYYRAKLLLALGDTAAALPTLLRIVRQKSTEYWVWQLLGETLRLTDKAAAVACYYRAAQCPADDIYLGRLRETLTGLLHAAGHLGEAQQQLRLLAQACQNEGKPLPMTARAMASQPWYAQTYQLSKAVAVNLLAAAEEAAYGDLPWQPVALQFVEDEQPGKSTMARLLPKGEGTRSLKVLLKKHQWLAGLPMGTPLQVKCELETGWLKGGSSAKATGGHLVGCNTRASCRNHRLVSRQG